MSPYVCHCVAPLQVAYLFGDALQTVTGQVEFSQGEDLTHTLWQHTQTVVRQVEALQLRKPEDKNMKDGSLRGQSIWHASFVLPQDKAVN